MKRKTFFNLVLIVFVLSFFVTPLGYEAKILLNQIFSKSPEIIENPSQKIDYDWQLKDRDDKQFNFKQSEGKVTVVKFWASWKLITVAELNGIQKLYDAYQDKVDFYIITNELPGPVEELMQKRGYDFKVTYLISGEKMPFDATIVPSGYVIDKKGYVRAKATGSADWNTTKLKTLLDNLIVQ